MKMKLFEVDEGQNIDLLESFCGSCPSDLFSKWMKAGSTHNPASFQDIC